MALPSLKVRIDDKLDEAEFFLDLMKDACGEWDGELEPGELVRHFRFYTSAFLSAVRSPIQYILETFKIITDPARNRYTWKTAEKQWYESKISGDTVLRFITDERDANIHTMQVKPGSEVIVSTEGPETVIEHEWDYFGTKRGVIEVCEEALREIEALIGEGASKGFYP